MRKSTIVKGHLPGGFACEARLVFRAFRDQPTGRRLALVEAFRTQQPRPCDAHDFLNDQPVIEEAAA